MPQFRYTHEGEDHSHVHDAKNLTEAINRAGQIIRDHHRVKTVNIDGLYEVGLAQDLLLPDEIVAVPDTNTDNRIRMLGYTRAIIPPPISVAVAGHTVAELRQRLGGLDPHTEVRLASRYPTPHQAGFHPESPFLEAAEGGSVYLCEGRVVGDLPAADSSRLGW